MKNQRALNRFANVVAPREMNAMEDVIILEHTDGSYTLFNKYTITKTTKGCTVHSLSGKPLLFSAMKYAVSWCVYDKRFKYTDADRIHDLDSKLCAMEISMVQHARLLAKATTADEQLIFVAKLTEERRNKLKLSDELLAYTRSSKNWQTARYEPKTAHFFQKR